MLKVDVPESAEEEEEYFDSAPVYNESDSFYTMNLSRPLLKAIEELKFVHPTPIQVIISLVLTVFSSVPFRPPLSPWPCSAVISVAVRRQELARLPPTCCRSWRGSSTDRSAPP